MGVSMSINDKLTRMHELNKTIHYTLNEAASLCGEVLEDRELKDAEALMDEMIDIADVCKNYATSVAFALWDCMKEKNNDRIKDHI